MTALSRYMVDRFKAEVAGYVRRNYTLESERIPDDELLSLIDTGIQNAQKYGITIEADVVRYIECMIIYGMGFDEDASTAWAGAILNDPELLGREKSKGLVQFLRNDSGGRP
jgi:hypothetical protein